MSGPAVGANRRMLGRLLGVALLMFGFGFAMVPLYDVFCEVTGIRLVDGGEIDEQAASRLEPDLTREVTVLFVANVGGATPFSFEPSVFKMTVHPGKTYRTTYFASNKTTIERVAHAVPSVAPSSANKHFNKTECFCFTSQAFGPGERKEMPVTFVVSPDLPKGVDTVTLSYTFFDSRAQGRG